MRPVLTLSTVAALLLATASPCFALWGIAPVSPDRAKELGIEVRAKGAGPNAVRVELEFKAEGELKNFGWVDLRLSDGDQSQLTVPLREERTADGSIVVHFSAGRTRLDQVRLWIMIPGTLGGTAYELNVKDFVEPDKSR